MLIAIPSKGRATKTTSQKVLKDAVFYVPESEAKAYQSHLEQDVIGVPDTVRGITATRNWILDGTDDPWVVMVDDDVKTAGWTEMQSHTTKLHKIKDWYAEFWRLFELMEDFNYRVWGVATQNAPRAIYPYKPILFHSYLTASCCGILNSSGIRFNEAYPVKEDYELGLRCIKEDGGFLAARYLYWVNSHWTDEGGCKTYRTGAMEKKCIDMLVKEYGSFIKRVHRNGTDYSIRIDY